MKDQEMIDTRALELATAANTRAKDTSKLVAEGFNRIAKWQEDHEKHDDDRFKEISDKISKGFSGVYARLWWFAGGIGATLVAVIFFLADKAFE